MSIRYLALNGNNNDQIKKDMANLKDTIKTFVSFADALRRTNDLIFLRLLIIIMIVFHFFKR